MIVCLVDLVAGQDHAEAGYVDCLPVEIHAGDPRARGAGGGVFVSVIDGGIPVQRACDGLGVGIENHLTGIKAMSGGGVIRAVERGGGGARSHGLGPEFNLRKIETAAVLMTARPARVLQRYRGAVLPDPSNRGEHERIPRGES